MQFYHPIYSLSSNEIHWWRWKSENIDCRKASAQGSRELFYWFPPLSDSLEVDEDPHLEEPDSGNKADLKPEKDECLWKINLLVTSIDKLNFDTTVNVEGEWFINENFRFGLLLCICLWFCIIRYQYWHRQWPLVSNECSNITACTNKVISYGMWKKSETHAMLSLKYQPSGKVKSQFYLEELSLSPYHMKAQRVILILHNSSIMDKSHVTWWKG